jgi:hypothetical protein
MMIVLSLLLKHGNAGEALAGARIVEIHLNAP